MSFCFTASSWPAGVLCSYCGVFHGTNFYYNPNTGWEGTICSHCKGEGKAKNLVLWGDKLTQCHGCRHLMCAGKGTRSYFARCGTGMFKTSILDAPYPCDQYADGKPKLHKQVEHCQFCRNAREVNRDGYDCGYARTGRPERWDCAVGKPTVSMSERTDPTCDHFQLGEPSPNWYDNMDLVLRGLRGRARAVKIVDDWEGGRSITVYHPSFLLRASTLEQYPEMIGKHPYRRGYIKITAEGKNHLFLADVEYPNRPGELGGVQADIHQQYHVKGEEWLLCEVHFTGGRQRG